MTRGISPLLVLFQFISSMLIGPINARRQFCEVNTTFISEFNTASSARTAGNPRIEVGTKKYPVKKGGRLLYQTNFGNTIEFFYGNGTSIGLFNLSGYTFPFPNPTYDGPYAFYTFEMYSECLPDEGGIICLKGNDFARAVYYGKTTPNAVSCTVDSDALESSWLNGTEDAFTANAKTVKPVTVENVAKFTTAVLKEGESYQRIDGLLNPNRYRWKVAKQTFGKKNARWPWQ